MCIAATLMLRTWWLARLTAQRIRGALTSWTLSLVHVSHPDMAITLHRWEHARLRSDLWRSDHVDAEGRHRFSEMGGQKSSKGPFTRIAWVGSVDTPVVPQKDKYAALFKSAGP